MGLSSSKTHPRVTQVAPMLSSEEVLGEPSLHPAATSEHGHPITHRQLPPLRQTGYRRASTGMEQEGGELNDSHGMAFRHPRAGLGRTEKL
uniref:Uncharacterized protein n=1 Tax=Phasianus colchicus TaxID=9054 RepID=A0A669QSJ1_PHACC